mgnify:CR=1 FL=1|tara:strand:- start:307 stop:762 length:456 start_codon:yes stop_codon:yes gene_type:complete
MRILIAVILGFAIIVLATKEAPAQEMEQPSVDKSLNYELFKIEDGECVSANGVFENVLGQNPGTELVEDISGKRLELFRHFYATYFKPVMIPSIDRLLVFENEEMLSVWVWGFHKVKDQYCVATDDFIHIDIWAAWIDGSGIQVPVIEESI